GHPTSSTSVPGGVFSHWSIESGTPSPSSSPSVTTGHPTSSTSVPGGVFSHWSIESGTPSPSSSPSVSSGHPLLDAGPGSLGQLSMLSGIPSPSESTTPPLPLSSPQPNLRCSYSTSPSSPKLASISAR